MPRVLSTRLVLLAICLALLSVLIYNWRAQCLSDGRSNSFCTNPQHLQAAMSATFISFPAAYLRNTTKRLQFGISTIAPIKSMPVRQFKQYSTGDTAKPAFTYRLAAASIAKGTSPRPAKAGQDFWSYASTHSDVQPPYLRSTKSQSGEDAFFATTVGGSKHHVAFGVADGVGGWQESGVDPSKFSHGLCGLMAGTAYMHEGLADGQNVRPKNLMQTAYDAVIGNPRILAGGSTASLAVADAEGGIETANLGDSGFLILGPGKVAHRSEPQTHAFNTPYQLAKIPAKMQAQHDIFGGSTQLQDTPKKADVGNYRLKHGDVVLVATDGVWDNLSAQDTLAIVTKVMEEQGFWFQSHNFAGAETMLNESLVRSLPQRIGGKLQDAYLPAMLATAVMREAKVAGLDSKRNGPFAKEVQARFPGEMYRGGKPDDIAVVVCIAVEDIDEAEDKPIKAKL
jgi:protein phosphatase PTC7